MKVIEFPKCVIRIEAQGVVRRIGTEVKNLQVGDRVAMVDRGVFSTTVITLEILCAKIPDSLDFDEASTMFFPFATAMHSLMTVGGLEKGQVSVETERFYPLITQTLMSRSLCSFKVHAVE